MSDKIKTTKKFILDTEKRFIKYERVKFCTFLANLTSMWYKKKESCGYNIEKETTKRFN